MSMKYKKKIFIYFSIVFAVFTIIVLMVEINREKGYKNELLESNMENYSDVIASYYRLHHSPDSLYHVAELMPESLRFTVIEEDGDVVFDNTLPPGEKVNLETHMYRPEVSSARLNGKGQSIRYSETNRIDYYYYAEFYGSFFVRVAYPYDVKLQGVLKADNYFIHFILLLFFITVASLLYLSDKFGKAVSGLKDFLNSVSAENPDFDKIDKIRFPDTEIGEIGSRIVETYRLLDEKNKEIALERDKITRHFNHLGEGIAIFSAERRTIYFNTHFIQLLNMILDEPTFRPESVLDASEFSEMLDFLNRSDAGKSDNVWSGKIAKGGNYFHVKLVVFRDMSFEVSLDNISNDEKNRLLKQEMTNNIAHELRTPVTTISGYVETLLDNNGLDEERKKYYLERLGVQVGRLSDLIRDIALITKTEEAASLFELESFNVRDTIEELLEDMSMKIREHSVKVNLNVGDNIMIVGNHTLFYSIFRNLVENSIAYAGDSVVITIDNYANDDSYCYFKFGDNGPGVPDEHLSRLFDRFYRVDKGRSRKSGGTGLGLSIVKNAVKFHNGEISVRNRAGGGLEFLFSIKRTKI